MVGDTDVGAVRPLGLSSLKRPPMMEAKEVEDAPMEEDPQEDSMFVRVVIRNLKGLTMGVPMMQTVDIPSRLHRHVFGFPHLFMSLMTSSHVYHMLSWGSGVF